MSKCEQDINMKARGQDDVPRPIKKWIDGSSEGALNEYQKKTAVLPGPGTLFEHGYDSGAKAAVIKYVMPFLKTLTKIEKGPCCEVCECHSCEAKKVMDSVGLEWK